MDIRRAGTMSNLALVLACAGFGQTLDKPQAAGSQKEKTLQAAVTESQQWKPTDPRVAKAYRELGDFYASQSPYRAAERTHTKSHELQEDSLGPANPQ